MNKHCYRLVFSRRLGMRVAVAENARSAGRKKAVALAAAALALPAAAQTARAPVVFASQLPQPAARLPQPVTNLFRDPANRGATTVLGSGTVGGWSLSADGRTATFDQGSADRVLLNWQSFDIAQGYTVRFLQDKDASKYVTALNRVWGGSPSIIQGQLIADREVQLINPNGVYFGATARVQAGKFVASALSVSDAAYNQGIRNITDGSAVFTSAGTDHLPTDPNAAVTVEAGAQITTAAGGDVLLVAPRVVNQGRIGTPDGQTVLAAGDKVYLMSSSDPRQRGLIVAVDAFTGADGQPDTTLGIAENSRSVDDITGQLNEIRAERGTVNLVGLAVRQMGTVNATTAVKGANGVVLLQSMATTTALHAQETDEAPARGLVVEAGSLVRVGSMLGTVEIGPGSVTSVQPEAGSVTQLDAEVFNPSIIRAEGATIAVGSGAQVLAPSGTIEFKAARLADADPLFYSSYSGTGVDDGSRIVVAPGAQISAAGLAEVAVDGARNQGDLRLFRIELADSPVQRSGPLYRSEVFFDGRDAGAIDAADVSGAAAAIARTAQEKSTAGGSISLLANGAVVVGDGAALDVSGGSVRYSATTIEQSLVARDGHVFTLASLPAGTRIDSLLPGTLSISVPAYSEGADGGTLALSGRQVALAGSAKGEVVTGEYQRDGRSARAEPATLALGLGSGTTFYLPAIALTAGGLPDLTAQAIASVLADPLTGDLSLLPATAALPLASVAEGGFGRLELRATGVAQPEFGRLDLGAGGSLEIAATTIALDGIFSAPGGSIGLSTAGAGLAGSIALSARTVLDVAGRWINDRAGAASAASIVQIDGGSVTLDSSFALTAEPGALIDVSGGAWLASDGSLAQGEAGSIVIAVQIPSQPPEPTMRIAGLQLHGWDFGSGGSLTLTAPSVTIAEGEVEAPGIVLAPEWFSAGGFGSISVTGGDLRVAAGTRLAPVLQNWWLGERYAGVASGAMTAAVATPQPLDTQLADRAPVSLSLAAARPLGVASAGGSLSIERGAAIELEPGAELSLSATFGIDVGVSGEAGQASLLSAPGGTIALAITGERGGDQDPIGFVGSQAIWLGPDARLSVAGTSWSRPDTSEPARFEFAAAGAPATPPGERRVGTVLGGGTIALDAARGYVVAEAGAQLALDGAAATLNLPGVAAAAEIAKPAGRLSLSSPEGIAFDATVSAQPPRDAAGQALADGGRLEVNIGTGGVLQPVATSTPYPDAPRVLVAGSEAGWVAASGATWGSDLSLTLGNGTAWVPAALLDGSGSAGFAGLTLGAGDAVRFERSLTLAVPLGLDLDAPAIAALPGVQVDIATSYARIGDSAVSRQGVVAPDTSGVADASPDHATRLAIHADTVDVVGNLGLQGFSTVALDAEGEIRLGALAPNFDRAESYSRRLAFAGELRLSAGQIYATSGSQYTLAGSGDDSQLVIRGSEAGVPALPPLTAFGSITATAADIDQGGVLRQPFGRIALLASDTLTLGPGSITSTSGEGAAVIYGTTLNLGTWVLPGTLDTASAGAAEQKGVTLAAEAIVTDPSATVSAAAGGSVLAWEFFAGVGGSKDTFADEAGWYAVLPDYAATAALPVGGGLAGAAEAAQQIVITMPGSGLAPGRYTLLPARWALLAGQLPQGAYLVKRADHQGSTTLRAPIANDDGSVVVAGYLSSAGATTVGAAGERFVVEPAATFNAQSDVRLTDVSDLRLARAAALGEARLLPRDGGQVQIEAGSARSLWTAALDLGADGVANAQAGRLDVAATQIALLGDVQDTPEASFGIAAGVLAASGAGSVLLGGLRSEVEQGVWQIAAAATQQVSVDLGGTPLALEELLLAASGRVTLAPGTALSATQSGTQGARTLQLTGDGALLGLSANALAIERTEVSGAQGTLELAAGSALAAPQLLLDATQALSLPADLQLNAQALALGAPGIVVGTPATAIAGATVLADGLQDGVRAAADLSLRAYEGIHFAGTQDWTAQPATRLVLDAPLIDGVAGADGAPANVAIAAQDVIVRNSSGLAAGESFGGSGSLRLQATPPLRYGRTGGIVIGPGDLALGFDSVALQTTGDIVFEGGGRTRARQDLSLTAERVTAATGADQQLVAAGTLTLAAAEGGRTLGERVGQGARIALAGRSVAIGGNVDLPGGRLTVHADGESADSAAIAIEEGARLFAGGFALADDAGFVTAGAAGAIALEAIQGRIALAGTLDVSAAANAGSGDAGSLLLAAAGAGGTLALAPTARIEGRAGSAGNDRGGSLEVDVTGLASADALAAAATAGGIDGRFALRVRSGDLALDTSLRAGRIELSADQGELTIGTAGVATLDASAGAGIVQLAAGADLVLGAGARIAASGAGDVLLASSRGELRLDAAAQVQAGDDGRIVLRALRGTDDASVQIAPLAAGQLQAGEVAVEAVRVYEGVNTLTASYDDATSLSLARIHADDESFMANRDAVLASLGLAGDPAVSLRAGVEVRSDGDLAVTETWNLAAERAGGSPGFLTLRATGQLDLAATISDGFVSADPLDPNYGTLNDNAVSWSYRFAAGADLTAANPLAVRNLSEGETGDLVVGGAGGTVAVRTGAGAIELAAGRDIQFMYNDTDGGPQSVYSAGRKIDDLDEVQSTVFGSFTVKPQFSDHGGRVELTAARDIVSVEPLQMIGNWLWRSGVVTGDAYNPIYGQLAWWTQFARFNQSVAAFGGGSVVARAGRNVISLQAMAPSAGWAEGTDPATATVHVVQGGSVEVSAGGDVKGGQFLLGTGTGRISAGSEVGAFEGAYSVAAPVLALDDGRWRITARSGVELGALLHPTAAPASARDEDQRPGQSGWFYTWGDDAGLSIVANAGDVRLPLALDAGAAFTVGLDDLALAATAVLPPSLSVTAPGGDVRVESALALFPSARGQLALWAGGDVAFGSDLGSGRLAMSGIDPALWPNVHGPATRSAFVQATTTLISDTLEDRLPLSNLHAGDPEPARLHADGSLVIQGSNDAGAIVSLPKPATLTAGADIVELSLRTEHYGENDLTRISAGRNVLGSLYGSIEVAGPGALEVSAGGSVDLGVSAGITTSGNLRNAALPAQGASVRVAAATAGTLDLEVLNTVWLAAPEDGGNARWQDWRELLLETVRSALAAPTLTYEQALAAFARFPRAAQAAFGQRLLAAEFQARYLQSAPPTASEVTQQLRTAFEADKAALLQAGQDALAAGTALVLPGRESLQGEALSSYLAEVQALSFESLDLGTLAEDRAALLASIHDGWPGVQPQSAHAGAIAEPSGRTFEAYRQSVVQQELAWAGAAASSFGRVSLPMRMALFDLGFAAAELGGVGSFTAQSYWPATAATAPLLAYSGSLDLTQSGIVTERGGDIALLNPGGAINVGLKEVAAGSTAPPGVIALGGGNIFGYAQGDFQVNTQRVFIVGSGDMDVWSSNGDIDSGRGANTAVAAPPLQARRSADGVVFEIPATTTGSGLGILADTQGRRAGTIGLFPAYGEILALDAFIRAPSLVLSAPVQGADNLVSGSISGSGAQVAAPTLSIAAPAGNAAEARGAEAAAARTGEQAKNRNSLLTVELLGMGGNDEGQRCAEDDEECKKRERR